MPKRIFLTSLLFLVVFLNEYKSQYYFFGRNKVQYEEFDWKVIKTAHFNIYYYGEFDEIAEIGAQYAETAFEELKIKFNHYLTRKIPLIFYNTHIHFQQTNVIPIFIPEGVGGFFEHMKGRVVVPYLGDLEKFKNVIVHELVHVFTSNKVANSVRDHRIGQSARIPLWFNEGIADYWSEQEDAQGEMVMRDAVLNNLMFGMQTFERLPLSYFIYKLGQNYVSFISQTYGEEKLMLILENTWRFKKFTEVIEFVLNETAEEIDNKWVFYLRKKYYPVVNQSYPHSISSKKQTDDGAYFNPCLVKSDSVNCIYYLANIDGYTSIYKTELDEQNNLGENHELILRGEKEDIFESFHLLQPSMTSSNNGLLAFVTKSKSRDIIHLYDTANEKLINSIEFERVISINHPSFSNDEKSIVFSGTDVKGFSDIFVVDIQTQTLQRITNDFYSDIDPIFSKDDSKIIFASNRTEGIHAGKYNLFSYDFSTHKINYLTYQRGNISLPKISIDGKQVYFVSDYDGVNNLWKLEIDSLNNPSGMSQKSHFITSLYNYTFTDTNKLITSAFENFSFQLFSLDMKTIPDSISKLVDFNFHFANSRWIPEKIDIKSEYDRYQYDKEYSLDYAFSQFITDPVYGSRGGAVLSLSDMLGDDRYYFMIYNSAEIQSDLLKNFNVAVTRVNLQGRTNYAYGVFHFSGLRYDLRESDNFFYERSFGGYFSSIYPLSSFQRLEASIGIANQDREIDTDIFGTKSLLLSNTISYVHDNSIWGPTGPVDGSRLRILLGYSSDIKYSNMNYYSFIADYRHYFRLHKRVTLATRTGLFYNHGKSARRYFAGGSWDLRGWRRFSVRGEKMWLSSMELRFPLIDEFYINFPIFGIGIANIRGAAFFDAGGAWDNNYKESLGSVGFGVRVNIGGVIVLRYDIGKKIEDDFSRFQNRLFYQFFFGWDF